VALLQLYQAGKVDLDAPVQKYVPEFPEKSYNGEKVSVTLRHLMSHLAGIRHYRNKEKGKEYVNDGRWLLLQLFSMYSIFHGMSIIIWWLLFNSLS